MPRVQHYRSTGRALGRLRHRAGISADGLAHARAKFLRAAAAESVDSLSRPLSAASSPRSTPRAAGGCGRGSHRTARAGARVRCRRESSDRRRCPLLELRDGRHRRHPGHLAQRVVRPGAAREAAVDQEAEGDEPRGVRAVRGGLAEQRRAARADGRAGGGAQGEANAHHRVGVAALQPLGARRREDGEGPQARALAEEQRQVDGLRVRAVQQEGEGALGRRRRVHEAPRPPGVGEGGVGHPLRALPPLRPALARDPRPLPQGLDAAHDGAAQGAVLRHVPQAPGPPRAPTPTASRGSATPPSTRWPSSGTTRAPNASGRPSSSGCTRAPSRRSPTRFLLPPPRARALARSPARRRARPPARPPPARPPGRCPLVPPSPHSSPHRPPPSRRCAASRRRRRSRRS